MKTKQKDPLAPVELVVSFLAGLIVALSVAFVVLAVTGQHVFALGFGDRHPCVSVPAKASQNYLQFDHIRPNDHYVGSSPTPAPILQPGVIIGGPDQVELCFERGVSGTERALYSSSMLVGFIWFLGFLVFVRVIIRRSRRHGLFTRPVAALVGRLGWYLALGDVLVDAAHSALSSLLVQHLIRGFDFWTGFVGYTGWSWATIIAGFALVTFGRVIAQTVPMREDLEATV